MKNVNIGRLLLDSTAVAAKHGLTLPAELVLFFKSIVSLEGMGRVLLEDFDFLTYSLEFAQEMVHSGVEPKRMLSDASVFARDANSLISTLPRQLKQVLRRLNDPDFAVRLRSEDLEALRKTVERGQWLTFWGMILAATILGLILRS
jgi:ubiquinone biosynthesis protein